MDIVGGLYVETCEVPGWSGLWGSGVRAALTVSRFSTPVTLHGYIGPANANMAAWLQARGVNSVLFPKAEDIAFSYFHPLSDPHIQPSLDDIETEATIYVEGENILRFGLLEGSARVNGGRVVYDPQSPHNPENFFSNGSTASELALVMNEQEFQAYSGTIDLNEGANALLSERQAHVIVVKRGLFGAIVFELGADPTEVPLYRSSRVFKIGTGDVFSGAFAHFWADKKFTAAVAADLASRAVSAYTEQPSLPINPAELPRRERATARSGLPIVVYGVNNTLGRMYTTQEAIYCIKALGMSVSRARASPVAIGNGARVVRFVIADGISDGEIASMDTSLGPLIVFDEENRVRRILDGEYTVKDDFTSAIYEIAMQGG